MLLRRLVLVSLILVVVACDDGTEAQPQPQELQVSPESQTVDQPLRAVMATDRTEPLGSENNLDEPVLWLNPNDSKESIIIATDKAHGEREIGGLRTYALDGSPIQEVTGFYPNNVDLLEDFPLRGEPVSLITTVDRHAEDPRILFFTVDSDPRSETYRQLIDISGSNLGLDAEPYGQALYRDEENDRWYVFVSERNDPFRILQFEITEGRGPDVGRVVLADTEPVRVIDVRPTDSGEGGAPLTSNEGMQVDPVYDTLYVGEELFGLLRYGARPSDGTVGAVVDRVTLDGGNILPEVEGVTIIPTEEAEGYIVVSGQNYEEVSRYEVYDRRTNGHLHSMVIAPRSTELPSANGTDGIYGFYGYLNDVYPHGIFIAHTDNGPEGTPSFLQVRFEDIWPEHVEATPEASSGNQETDDDPTT